MKNNKGYTLIEVIIVLAILTMVIAGSFSVLSFGNTVHRKSLDEYEIQANVRLTAENINRISRYASATFTIPESSFREDNLTDGWSYVGIIDGAVVLYEYKDSGGVVDHYKRVIAPASNKLEYKIFFKEIKDEEDYDEKIIGFSILGFIKGKPIKYDEFGNPIGHITIVSQLESLNSLQVVHKGNGIEDATAIAFRSEERDDPVIEESKPIAQIALVLDTSGSMEWKMDGSTTYSEEDRRISKLKNSAKRLIDNFAATDYPHYVSLVPFSTGANNPGSFLLVKDNSSTLKNTIGNLDPEGGTNTGDGMRRAYYQIVNNRSNSDFDDKVVKDYMIILVDGVSTYGSVISRYNNNFFIDDGDIRDWRINEYIWQGWSRIYGQVAGNGSSLDKTYGKGYVKKIGEDKIVADGDITVYVIGFAKSTIPSVEQEFRENLNYIGQKAGAEVTSSGNRYYLAGDEDELDIIFGEIQKEILNELWYIDGPQL